jgi:hypothetical protein
MFGNRSNFVTIWTNSELYTLTMGRSPVPSAKSLTSSRWLVACVLGTGMLLTGCNVPRMSAEKTLKVTASTENLSTIEIESQNGSITVICQPDLSVAQIEAEIICRAETQVAADERLAATELVVQESDGKLKIYPKFPEPLKNGEGVSIRLAVPSVDAMVLTTGNGSVEVDGSNSPVRGNVKVQTSNGSITIRSAQSVNLETSNGAIPLEKITDDVASKTSNAEIVLTDVGGKIDAVTTNGNITVTLSNGQHGPIQAQTSNSSIKLQVANDFSGTVNVKTSNAGIGLQDPANKVTQNSLTEHSGSITVGSGEGVSQLTTSNGSIDVSVAP